jgi:hypothetical protein
MGRNDGQSSGITVANRNHPTVMKNTIAIAKVTLFTKPSAVILILLV